MDLNSILAGENQKAWGMSAFSSPAVVSSPVAGATGGASIGGKTANIDATGGRTSFTGAAGTAGNVQPYDFSREGIGGAISRVIFGAPANARVSPELAGGGVQYMNFEGLNVPTGIYDPNTGWSEVPSGLVDYSVGKQLGMTDSDYINQGVSSNTNITGAGDTTTYEAGAFVGAPDVYHYDIDNKTVYEEGAVTTHSTTHIGGASYSIQNAGASAPVQQYSYDSYEDDEEETRGKYYDPVSGMFYS